MSSFGKPAKQFSQKEMRFFHQMSPNYPRDTHSMLDWMNHSNKKQGYAEKNRIINISLFVCLASILIVISGVI